MSQPRDYYDILGIARDASEEEIRRAYRVLARKYHPDVNKDPDASQRFSEVTEAYDVLSDQEKRQQYDRLGHAGVAAGPGSAAGAGSPGGAGARWSTSRAEGFDPGQFGDLFEDLFGGGMRGGAPFGAGRAGAGPGGPRGGPIPRAGRDVHHTVAVTFLTAVSGGRETIRLTDASGPSREIDVRIPAGIEHGSRLRIRGQGQPGQQGGRSGDLILTVHVGRHHFFRREGLNILLEVPISLAEAATGTDVTIPLLEGTAELRIPPGTSSGRKLRLREKGICAADGRVGDFLAVVQVIAPEQLTETARKAVEMLAGELQNPRESAPWADLIRERSDDS